MPSPDRPRRFGQASGRYAVPAAYPEGLSDWKGHTRTDHQLRSHWPFTAAIVTSDDNSRTASTAELRKHGLEPIWDCSRTIWTRP
ncbi:MAG: hypothetical protein AAF329_02525 [Cyanobacteria bacterium P01_A01_bin.17]